MILRRMLFLSLCSVFLKTKGIFSLMVVIIWNLQLDRASDNIGES